MVFLPAEERALVVQEPRKLPVPEDAGLQPAQSPGQDALGLTVSEVELPHLGTPLCYPKKTSKTVYSPQKTFAAFCSPQPIEHTTMLKPFNHFFGGMLWNPGVVHKRGGGEDRTAAAFSWFSTACSVRASRKNTHHPVQSPSLDTARSRW